MKKKGRIIGLVVSFVVTMVIYAVCLLFGLNDHLAAGIGAFVGIFVGLEVRDRIRERSVSTPLGQDPNPGVVTDTKELHCGMRVRTKDQLGETTGMLVAEKHLFARRSNKEGLLAGYVPGHGGDVWWVHHDDGTVGAYSFEEFDPI